MLLELFKYITENPRSSDELLEKLRITESKKTELIEGLVF